MYAYRTPSNSRLTSAGGTGVGAIRAIRSGQPDSASSEPSTSALSPLRSGSNQTGSGVGLSSTASSISFSKALTPEVPLSQRPGPLSRSLDSIALRGNSTTNAQSSYLIPSIDMTLSRQGRSSCKSYVTIVFDLDETLVNNRRPGRAIIRPGALDLLRHLRSISNDTVYVEIILWTASMECVAKPVVARLDPSGLIFDHLIYRDKRWYKETGYTKDLRRLGRDMRRTMIVENSPLSVELNRKNSILVRDFTGLGPGASNDSQLQVVKDCLTEWIQEVESELNREPPTPSLDGSASSGSKEGSPSPSFVAKTAAKESPVSEAFPHAGPTIVDFLSKHPHISAGNEIITVYPKSAVTGVVGTTQRAATTRLNSLGVPAARTSSQAPYRTANSWRALSYR